MTFPTPNTDESLALSTIPFIGNFHKTLPHNEYGEVDPVAYRGFERTCLQVEAGMPVNFEDVARGPLTHPAQTALTAAAAARIKTVANFTSPLAGASAESHGPDPKSLEMPPAPGCLSISATAEIVELYWMALLRDAPLVAFQSSRNPPAGAATVSDHDGVLGYPVTDRITNARRHVNTVFDCAVENDRSVGALRTPTDLQVEADGEGADIALQTLFRSGLEDEQHGPLISQFFLRTIGFGTQHIDQTQVPYVAKRDYLISHDDWLLAQNTGYDRYGRSYGTCNHYADQSAGNIYYPTTNGQPNGPLVRRHISTMRDLARFVNRDALHQAYFNAALFLDGAGARLDAGNPYAGNRFNREGAFATLGGPDLLTLVSEVASRALKVVWRQKWLVHRRARPEVFAGLLQMQRNGYNGTMRNYGIALNRPECSAFGPAVAATLQAVTAHNAAQGAANSVFLPMAFSAGSPTHPAYGAGHATVAGACVTVLKAWFDEDQTLDNLFAGANAGLPKDPPGGVLQVLQPGHRLPGTDLENFSPPSVYLGADRARMTVGGELNKIASNVAMGRSMGGVHWRSDNTRSLRLGEKIAIEILRKRTLEYAERPVSFDFRSFDRQPVHITQGQVHVG